MEENLRCMPYSPATVVVDMVVGVVVGRTTDADDGIAKTHEKRIIFTLTFRTF